MSFQSPKDEREFENSVLSKINDASLGKKRGGDAKFLQFKLVVQE